MKITVGLVINFPMFLEAVSDLIDSMPDFALILLAKNGLDLQHQFTDNPGSIPELMLIDIDMPVIDGLETTMWLREHHPGIRLIALAKNERDRAIISMLKAGCCSYLSKYFEPVELKNVLKQVHAKGYFNPGKTQSLKSLILGKPKVEPVITLTSEEHHFLRLACTEVSYEQILIEMNIKKKTGNKHIDSLFKKFGVNSRLALVLEVQRGCWVKERVQ